MKYTWDDLKERVEEINKGKVILSNQYGMIFLLNQDNEILLCLTDLVEESERKKYS